jgi:hypothetical protein
MDTVMMAVTILSLAMAVAMACIVATLMREARARSDARVTALAAMAAQPAADAPLVPAPRPAALTRIASAPAAQPSRLDDFDLRPSGDATVTGVSHLFEETTGPSPWGRRLAVIGSLAAIVFAIGFVLTSGQPQATAAPAAASAAQHQPVVLDSAPLELVSLRHTQEAQRLVITGLVQNPRTGSPLSHVVATAFLFGPDGAFLTSSRAQLDFTTLSPGDESPFVVNVPVTGQVSRYRIGFRTDDGRVIEHVDKRTPDALASK